MDEKLIVECQFKRNDNDHLGKLISYASVDPSIKYIVWLVEKNQEIHKMAIRMLN